MAEILTAESGNVDAMFSDGIPAQTFDAMFSDGYVYHDMGTITDSYAVEFKGENIPRNEMVYAEAHKISDVVQPGVPIYNPVRGRVGGKVIKLNSDQLRQHKQKLNQAANEIKNIWNTLKNTHIKQLTESWAGTDAASYIRSFNSFDSKVNASVEALDLLARTFERAARELESTQENIKTIMNNIN